MVKHNNVVPNQHFHKQWARRVKTWFHQAPQKKRRREKRAARRARIFPRPDKLLRPVVRPPTVRYNSKQRLGRGFTLEELKGAGINARQALSIGIAVDHRRRNKSEQSYTENVQRLKKYKANLILFPRKPGKPKAGDASAEEIKNAEQQTGTIFPITKRTPSTSAMAVSDADRQASAFVTLRRLRADQRLVGIRKKRAEAAAEAAANRRR